MIRLALLPDIINQYMNDLKNILIEGDLKSPSIDFNYISGDLILSGRSIPENAAKVYEPLLVWIKEYIRSPRKVTNFRFNLEYFNSSSTIWIIKLLRTLGKIQNQDYVLMIHIYFETEDFDELNEDEDEINHLINSLIDNLEEIKVSIGVKTYSKNHIGRIMKESTILI